MDKLEVIHCIGDSHASFFSGYDQIQPQYPQPSPFKYPFFRSYRLGAVLAYNVNKLGTKEKGRESFLDLLSSLPDHSNLLLCYGEIDCRAHLLKQSEKQQRPLKEIIEDCIHEYTLFIDELRLLGHNVLVWNAIPSATSDNIEYPSFGTTKQRNECTIMFNEILKRECGKRQIGFVSIYEKLLDKKLNIKIGYFFDDIHLGQLAMPFAINEIRKSIPGIGYSVISKQQLSIMSLQTKINYAAKTAVRSLKKLLKGN